jgi:hypothetical protein
MKADPFETLAHALRPKRGATPADAEVLPPKPTGDKRAHVLRAEDRDHTVLRERTRLALGASVGEVTDETLGAVVDDLETIRNATNVVTAKFLEVGRALLRVQERAGPGGYKAIYEAGLIPLPEATASRLRTIAAAVDSEKFPVDRLPRTVESAYYAAKLPPAQRQRLIEDDVIRPEASRQEILRASKPPVLTAPSGGKLTPIERKQLERIRDRLLARVREIEERLAHG